MAAADPDLLATATLLAGRRVFGIVWLDAGLIVRKRFGPLVDFVPLDRPVTDSILALLGAEDQIRALRHSADRALEIPNVSFDHGDGRGPRINIQVFYDRNGRRYVVLVSLVMTRADLELELAQNIRARSIAEAELAQKSAAIARANAELARANQDLEEFAYVISHDLRAPLRALRYFSGDLEAALKASNAGEAELQLARVRAQVARMSSMLSGLHEYSRIGRKDEVVEPVDTQAMISEIVLSQDKPRGISVDIDGTWPRLETLRAPLDLVLRNLIDNAIKHHDREDGRITVAAREAAEDWLFTVSDDGPGIPPSWHKAIFLPFRRIAGDDAAEGAGIGLALINRTVEHIGGSVEVASEAPTRRGTTFTVRWPKVLRL